MTKDQVQALKTPELVALYNRLTASNVKRFSTRATAEKRVLEALSRQPAPRTVSGNSSAAIKKGRPRIAFIFILTESQAKSHHQKGSIREQLCAWLKTRTHAVEFNGEQHTLAATIDEAEQHFNRKLRGVIQKLEEKKWVRRVDLAVPA